MGYLISDELQVGVKETIDLMQNRLNCFMPTKSMVEHLDGFQKGQHDFRSAQRDLVDDIRDKWVSSSLDSLGIITIGDTEYDDYSSECTGKDIYVQRNRLTNMGLACFLTLKRGCCWNYAEHTYDPYATEEYYKYWCEQDFVPDDVFEMMLNLNDPYVNHLRNKLLAFKMKAKKKIINQNVIWMEEND